MTTKHKIMILPGDGIGREVTDAALRLIHWLADHRNVDFEIQHGLIGGASVDVHGTPLTDETLSDAFECDAILFGAAGAPQYDHLPFENKPERGLLRLRKELDLFANLRPAITFPSLIDASTLKPDFITGLDILILRENTGGVYFAEPRGTKILSSGEKTAFDTNLYSSSEIKRIGQLAFALARQRQNKVTSVDKANVMYSGVLWREEMTELYEKEGQGLAMEHMYADNCAMQLVRNPKQFDVIVMDNLFGDILSDCAAMLTGSLGMLPSASLGHPDTNGRYRKALYEPVHGSAPDITGKGLANPLAQILSLAMMLRYSLDRKADARLIETAIDTVLKRGYRTVDIMSHGCHKTTTAGMVDALIDALNHLTHQT